MTQLDEFLLYAKEHALPDSAACFALWNAWKESEREKDELKKRLEVYIGIALLP